MVPAIVFSLPLVGGGVSTGAVVTNGPTKLGASPPPQRETQPTGGELTSITSAGVRPKVGVPQICRASLVWSGPSTVSPVTNTICVQKSSPPVPGIAVFWRPSRRNLLHCE